MSVNGNSPPQATGHERLAAALRARLLRYGGLGIVLGVAVFEAGARHGGYWLLAAPLLGALIVAPALATRTTRALAGAFSDRLVLVGCLAVAAAFGLGIITGGIARALYGAFL